MKLNCPVCQVRKQTHSTKGLMQGHWQDRATEAITKVSTQPLAASVLTLPTVLIEDRLDLQLIPPDSTTASPTWLGSVFLGLCTPKTGPTAPSWS